MWQVVLQGMGVGVALAAPIGPINLEIVRRGLSGGFFRGWLVGFGAVLADTIYCALIVGGLAPVADSPALRAPLFLAGAVVLGYLGTTGLRAAIRGGVASAPPPTSRRSLATGFVMAIANPFGIVYWLSIGAALIASAVASAGPGAAPSLVAGVFVGIVGWVTFLSGLTQAGRRFVSAGVLRWLGGAAAIGLLAFGASFAVQGIAALRAL